jgi:hypothetical protein
VVVIINDNINQIDKNNPINYNDMKTIGPLEILLILLIFVPGILYLRTLSNVLKKCSTQNRKLPPSQVWLLLVPLFNLVWQFFVMPKVSDTLRTEYRERNIKFKGDMGETVGLFFCISICIHILATASGTAFMIIPTIILWIMHWVKISELSRVLSRNPIRNTTAYME